MRKGVVDISLRVLVSSVLVISAFPAPALAEGAGEIRDAAESIATAGSENADYIVDWTECGTCVWSIDSEGALVVKPADGKESGSLTDIPWSYYKSKVRSVRFEGSVEAPSSFAYAFQDMAKLESVNFSGLDTSKCWYMSGMFYGCSKLKSVDFSGFDTSSAIYMEFMFAGCSSLKSLDLSGFDTSSVTSMYCMFQNCSSLESLNLSKLDTFRVGYMWGMFEGCSSLISLDLASFKTPNVTSYNHMFDGCSSLSSLDISGFDTSIIKTMSYMLDGCNSLASIKLGSDFSFCGSGEERLVSLPGRSWKSSSDGKSYPASELPNNVAATYTLEKWIEDYIYSLDLGDEDWTGSPIRKDIGFDGLTEGVDYRVEYSNNVDPGTATITITGMGGYTGTLTYQFNILGPDYTCSEDDSSISVSYSGDASNINWLVEDPSVVQISSISTTSISWGSYQQTQATVGLTPLKPGLTRLVGYAGSTAVCSYSIYVKASTKVDISSSTVALEGDDYRYTGNAIVPSLSVKVGDTLLVEGTDYYLDCLNNVDVGDATVVITGVGNYKGTSSVSFRICAADASQAQVVVDDQAWTGSELEPEPTVTLGDRTLAGGIDYDVSYSDNIESGTATVTVTFKGNYAGAATGTFEITKEESVADDGRYSGMTRADGRESLFSFEADGESSVKVALDSSTDMVTLSVVDSDGNTARYNGDASGAELVAFRSVGGGAVTLAIDCGVLPKGAYSVKVRPAPAAAGKPFSGAVQFSKKDPVAETVTMHRLYNPYTGEHLYTASTEERDKLTALGWKYEGVGWTAPKESSTPVYRLYNPYVAGGDHHYTTSKEEYDKLAEAGWKQEGVAWYSDDDEGTPLYRQYNPYAATGTHNYTTSKAENDALVKLGWRAEGVGWYGVK